ncbi:OS9 isoform 13, partial [Pan troglodytes]
MAAETLLSSLLGLLLLGLLLPASLTGGVGSLNLEELSEMRYGIEILPLPVMGGQSQSSDVVIVSSKYKQRYECRLPAGAIHFQREREEETPAYQGPGIPELLSPMRDAPCLLKTKDWWTYEFCYGRHIQQYHMEGILLPSDRDRLRSEVKAGMERELENIIQETEKELDPDGLKKESERDRAMLAL